MVTLNLTDEELEYLRTALTQRQEVLKRRDRTNEIHEAVVVLEINWKITQLTGISGEFNDKQEREK